MHREHLASRLGFILLSAGCAIGIGNVWKFPWMTGQYGGGAFVVIYLIFLLILGVPVLTMEFAMGRASQKSPLKMYQTLKPGSHWRWHGYACLVGNSLPNFFVALLLMQLFSIKWKLLPVISGGTTLQSAILPTLTLAIAMSAKYMRQVRAAVLEELNKDYVLGAAARGVRRRVILWKSVLKSAMLTILTLLALSIGSLLGGTAIIESIFMWDGVGKLAVDAITMRDYPLIQAYVVWMAIIYVMVNLVTDILYHVLDPRIRLGVQAG